MPIEGQIWASSPTTSAPDGHKVSLKFWLYKEIGTCKEEALIRLKNNSAEVTVPQTAQSGDTLHIIVVKPTKPSMLL